MATQIVTYRIEAESEEEDTESLEVLEPLPEESAESFGVVEHADINPAKKNNKKNL